MTIDTYAPKTFIVRVRAGGRLGLRGSATRVGVVNIGTHHHHQTGTVRTSESEEAVIMALTTQSARATVIRDTPGTRTTRWVHCGATAVCFRKDLQTVVRASFRHSMIVVEGEWTGI